ncbi:MAG: hypothetical protein ABW352_18895 [Polyangiales bacterium]
MRGSLWFASSLTLFALACSEEPAPAPTQSLCSEGDDCECEDGSAGSTVCEDDEAVCECADKPSGSVDAGQKRDASKPTVPQGIPLPDPVRDDAGREPEPSDMTDGGVDAATPPVDVSKPDPATLPKPKGKCPTIKDGSATFAGIPVRLYVGNDGEQKLGPLVFYWYATGSSASEVTRGLSNDIIEEIKDMGGMVAVFERSLGTGQSTGNFVWFVDDYNVADEVLACALEQKVGIDTSHIHAIGFSAGGLQSSWMAYARNNYMASIVAYSGGLTGLGAGTWVTPVDDTPDPSNVVSAMLVHGAPGRDVVIMDFAAGSAAMQEDIKKRGGLALDCNHGGGHMIPAAVPPSAWQFMQDHPYKLQADPYASGIPASFPKYCKP